MGMACMPLPPSRSCRSRPRIPSTSPRPRLPCSPPDTCSPSARRFRHPSSSPMGMVCTSHRPPVDCSKRDTRQPRSRRLLSQLRTLDRRWSRCTQCCMYMLRAHFLSNPFFRFRYSLGTMHRFFRQCLNTCWLSSCIPFRHPRG